MARRTLEVSNNFDRSILHEIGDGLHERCCQYGGFLQEKGEERFLVAVDRAKGNGVVQVNVLLLEEIFQLHVALTIDRARAAAKGDEQVALVDHGMRAVVQNDRFPVADARAQ